MPAPAAPPGLARLGHWGSWTVGECGQGPGKRAQTQPLAPAVSPVLGCVDGVGRKKGSDSGSSLGRLGVDWGPWNVLTQQSGSPQYLKGCSARVWKSPIARRRRSVGVCVCGILGAGRRAVGAM